MSNTILTAKNLCFSYQNKVILDDVSLTINAGDRIALLGRNGMGKSTLLKLLELRITPDSGLVEHKNDLKVAQLAQNLDYDQSMLASEVLLANNQRLSQAQADNLVQAEITKDRLFTELSGGQQRRLLLRSVLLSEPDLIILDEPTNHVDILTIRAILKQLKHFRGACLIISHDRWFIEQISENIWDLHNGKVRKYNCDFNSYRERKQEYLDLERAEQEQRRLKLKQEEHWLQRGVTARRKRNIGRLERLQALRSQVKSWRDPERRAKLSLAEQKASAKKVISIDNLTVKIKDKVILKDFSYEVIKGEKIGLVGENGIGKTTLIKHLLTESTAVKHGEQLNIAYFAQQHQTFNSDETALGYMSTHGEYIIQGERRLHVASYLKGFNFDEQQLSTKVTNLSGGERHRLMLAKCLAKPANFLILDEPTNDLDLETLEILEQLLVEFKGTIIIISHDQRFLDNVITSCWIMREQEILQAGGELKTWQSLLEKDEQKSKTTRTKVKTKATVTKKLSYHEQQKLLQLPVTIEQLEVKIAARQSAAAQPEFYQKPATEIKEFQVLTANLEQELAELYQLWEELEQRS